MLLAFAEQAADTGDQSSVSGVLYGALIGLAGVLLTALLTQWFTQYRERAARLAESQRAALYDFQDACFELRQAFRRYSSNPTPKQERAIDRAYSHADVRKARLLDDLPAIKYGLWSKAAEKRFLDGAPFHTEEAAWRELHLFVGKALRTWR